MIGFDLQEVERVKEPEKLLKKIARESEIDYIQRFPNFRERVASLWAVKEATFKALCTFGEEISFKDIELSHTIHGAPKIILHGKAKQIFEEKKFSSIEVSLSHQKSVVGAVVLLN